MLSIKMILYLIFLMSSAIGSVVYHPFIGILGYLLTYQINPGSHWWGRPIGMMGIHYSKILVVATGLGILLHLSRLKFKRLLQHQEILLILFLGLMWLSIPLGFGFSEADSNVIKMTKVTIVLLMASHIITDLKKYEIMIWTLIIAGLYLGYKTFIAPDWMFQGARFESGVGGSDFAEGNFLGAHFAMVLPFIGVMFLKGGWKSRIICLISAVFVVNAIILCRSRGVFLAILTGLFAAVLFSLPGYRIRILSALGVALIGGVLLTDPGFWGRMETITVEESQMDASAEGRIVIWRTALSMVSDHPLGVGEGNFKRYIGFYSPEKSGRDTHNTYLRCLAELGIQGLFVYGLLILNAFRVLSRIKLRAEELKGKDRMDFLWHVYGLRVALVTFLAAGMTITHTYIEELYWLLIFPVFLERALENENTLPQSIYSERL